MNADMGQTSAGGLASGLTRETLIAVSIFSAVGTTSGTIRASELISPPGISQPTNAGCRVLTSEPAGGAIAELRRRSGLTWDQLARLFGVSRRSLHFWASGKPMVPANEEHLQRVLSVVRRIDRGDALANRSALLTATPSGDVPFDLLADGEYERVVSIVGIGHPRELPTSYPLSENVRRERLPLPPEVLLGTVEDRVDVRKGRLLSSKPLRKPRSG